MTSLTAEMAPMHERRPFWVKYAIAMASLAAKGKIPKKYGYFGLDRSKNYRYFSDDETLHIFDILEKTENEHERSLRVLDVGTGAGAFLLHCIARGHEAIGISIHDFGKDSRFESEVGKLPTGAYVVADAHHMDRDRLVDGSFDLVASNMTMIHVIDKLSVLEQMAGRVGVGGRLVVDDFHYKPKNNRRIYTDEITAEVIFGALEDGGFELEVASSVAVAGWFGVNSIIALRRDSTQPVRIPAEYRPEPLETLREILGE